MAWATGLLVAEPAAGLIVAVTSRRTGDLGIDAEGIVARRRTIAGDRDVAWITQVHGAGVARFSSAARADRFGTQADAAVTSQHGLALSVVTADCVPIALWSDDGTVGVVHAGWRGLLAGVVERAVDAMRERSAADAEVHALIGPAIHPECYEFSSDDLALVARSYGDAVRSTTAAGSPALDMPSAVSAALASAGARRWTGPEAAAFDTCTACDDRWYSWRARRDTGRQAMLIWRTE